LKAVILAGGLGTRIVEETKSKPKPMIRIGDKPILWHIMKIYSTYGINDFVICCGYKKEIIEKYFKNFEESWDVKLVNTGLKTMTGGRLKKVEKLLHGETFCFTYGDTLSNVNIKKLIDFHLNRKRFSTVTACHPPEKYGILEINGNIVKKVEEKPPQKKWVNGGFFVLEPEIFDYIKDNSTSWEVEPMQNLSKDKQLSAYKHTGFYQPMDTVFDRNKLERMWKNNNALWKIW